jgi:cytidylate kinase
MAVLTVSRQFGAGGKTLADRIAQRLGYTVASEAIIEQLAESARISPQGISDLDTEQGWTSPPAAGILAAGRFIERLLHPQRKFMDGQVYLQLLREIVPKLAEAGDTVIVGRGAQFILRGYPDTYHVLLLAGKQDRMRFMVDHYDLLLPQAKRIVRRQDKRRLRLMQLFSEEDFDRPWNYDLVLNMSRLTMEAAVAMVCGLVSEPFEATGFGLAGAAAQPA